LLSVRVLGQPVTLSYYIQDCKDLLDICAIE